jgi:hypothetical protein
MTSGGSGTDVSQGLPKQRLAVPLGYGLETSIDPKLLPVGKVTTSENVLWTAQGGTGTAVKRPGYVAVPQGFMTSGSAGNIPKTWQFAQHKGATVSMSVAGPRPIGVFSPDVDLWATPPASQSDTQNAVLSRLRGQLLATREPVYRPNSSTTSTTAITEISIATDGIYVLATWLNIPVGGAATIQARILELDSGKVLFQNQVASGTGSQIGTPRAVYCGGFLSLVYKTQSTHIAEIHWSTTTLGTGNGVPSGVQTLATDLNSTFIDTLAIGFTVNVLYGAVGKTNRITYTAGSPGGFTDTEIKAQGGASIAAAANWVTDLGGTGKQAITSCSGAGLVLHYDVATGTAVTSTTIDSTGGPYFASVAYTINSGGDVMAVSQISIQPGGPIRLAWKVGASTGSKTWLNSTSLLSKPFTHNGDFYVCIAYESQTQGTNFAIRVPSKFSGALLDTADYTQAPGARYCSDKGNGADGTVVEVTPLSDGRTFISGTVVRTRLVTTAAGPIFDTGIDILTMQFDPPSVGSSREFADSTYICGGLLGAFDGQQFAEEGFHVFPDDPVITPTAGGSMTLLGAYYYQTVFRYTDNNGRVHRSAPTKPVPVTLTGSTQSVSIVQKTLKLTGRPGQNVIELYRVNSAGDTPITMYLVSVTPNDETVDTVTITDGTADRILISSLNLYSADTQTPGVLPSGPPPSPLAMCVYKQCLACVDADDPTLVRASLPLTDFDGEGWPIFDNDEISSFRIEDIHGDITGVAAMDDKMLVFKNDAVYVVTGDGPDITGNGTWGVPAFVSTGIGCSYPRSIVETPDGVVFLSTSKRAGYYMINRGLTLQYIGSPIQGYLGQDTVVDGVYVPSESRVMFFNAQGNTRVYDQALSEMSGAPQWTTFTNQAAGAAGLLAGLPIYQKSGGGAILTEDVSGIFWDENGTANDEFLLTPWLSLADLKGYERFYKIQGLGNWKADHTLTITLFTNFNDGAPLQSRSIQMSVAAGNQDWNLWELKYPNKATSIRFGVRIGRATGAIADTAGANIQAIVLEYGVRQGMRRIPAANRLT